MIAAAVASTGLAGHDQVDAGVAVARDDLAERRRSRERARQCRARPDRLAIDREIGRAEREIDQHDAPLLGEAAGERNRRHGRADVAQRADHRDPPGGLARARRARAPAPRSASSGTPTLGRRLPPLSTPRRIGGTAGSAAGARRAGAAGAGNARGIGDAAPAGAGSALEQFAASGRSPPRARTSRAPRPARSAASSARTACSRRPRVEMMRASGDAAPMLSRAVASRYLAR